jgi:hypothetical protein
VFTSTTIGGVSNTVPSPSVRHITVPTGTPPSSAAPNNAVSSVWPDAFFVYLVPGTKKRVGVDLTEQIAHTRGLTSV